jgi:hydroxymethylglutaryl-CoA reductase (NADPH)
MTTSSEKAKHYFRLLRGIEPLQQIFEEVQQKDPSSLNDPLSIPGPLSWSRDGQLKRLAFLKSTLGVELPQLGGDKSLEDPHELKGNIEHYIGMTQVPTGLVGPLLLNGTEAKGDFYVPLATSEGALVASYNRGARATRISGGITSICLTEGVQRTPVFRFNNISEIGHFMLWVLERQPEYQEIISRQSRHAKLEDIRINMEGNQVLLIFDYTTGDAAGQNMVTLCTDAVCRYIVENVPVKPQHWFIESNYSGDKKATAVSFASVRGKKVTAETTIPDKVVREVLNSSPQLMAQYWQTSTIATVQSGALGIQGHFANGLAALFLATGQDVACVSEAAMGITRMEVNNNGDLYAAVTLPNMIVGTVGGGTGLPTQKECLQMMDCYGNGKARKFAEVCAATVLAGEISIAAALSAGHFTKAHKLFGRKVVSGQV